MFIINGLGRGGGERLLSQTVAALAPADRLAVFCLTREGPYADEIRRLGVPVRALTRRGLPRPAAWRALARELRRCDVVNTHFFYSDLLGALLRAAGLAPALVATRHETGFWMRPWHRPLERWVTSRADAVLCVSAAVAQSLTERGAPRHKLVTVRPGVTLPDLSRRRPRPFRRVVSVGRLETVKGHDVLLAAWARLPMSLAGDAELRIVGDGGARHRLEALAARLRLTSCRFLGSRGPLEVDDELASAAAFVLPSRSEGLPLALLEAMAWALPVVASAVGGVVEVVEDGLSGALVPPGDDGALAAALARVLDDTAGAARMGGEARRRVERDYPLAAFTAAARALYARVATDRGPI